MEKQTSYPLALTPPKGKVVLINDDVMNQAILASRESPRKRIILPFHKSSSDNFHRMLNALQPGSYVQPHRHLHPPKVESIIVLKGSIRYIEFNNSGDILNHYKLAADSVNIGIDTEPGVFHTFFATTADTVLFEAKPGPYEPGSDKDFASWAPKEGSEKADEYLGTLNNL